MSKVGDADFQNPLYARSAARTSTKCASSHGRGVNEFCLSRNLHRFFGHPTVFSDVPTP